MQRSTQDELAAAIAAERAAWARVKDRLPGAPQYDAALWEYWREAASRCHAARAAMRAESSAMKAAPPGPSAGAAGH